MANLARKGALFEINDVGEINYLKILKLENVGFHIHNIECKEDP